MKTKGYRLLTCMVAVILVATIMQKVNAAGDQVINGGFEISGSPNWNAWQENAGTGSIANESTNVHAGIGAARLTGGNENDTLISQTFSVIPGSRYRLEFYTRGDATNAGQLSVYGSAPFSDYIIAITTTGVPEVNYSGLQSYFFVPANCTEIILQFRSPSAEGGIAYFDDVSLEEDNLPPTVTPTNTATATSTFTPTSTATTIPTSTPTNTPTATSTNIPTATQTLTGNQAMTATYEAAIITYSQVATENYPTVILLSIVCAVILIAGLFGIATMATKRRG